MAIMPPGKRTYHGGGGPLDESAVEGGQGGCGDKAVKFRPPPLKFCQQALISLLHYYFIFSATSPKWFWECIVNRN